MFEIVASKNEYDPVTPTLQFDSYNTALTYLYNLCLSTNVELKSTPSKYGYIVYERELMYKDKKVAVQYLILERK